MTVDRRIKHSRLLIITGIELIITCLIIIIIGAFLKMVWLIETAAIVAILLDIFIFSEFWNVKRLKKH